MAEIVIMDFSGIYKGEQFFEGEKVSWLDVREIPGGIFSGRNLFY